MWLELTIVATWLVILTLGSLVVKRETTFAEFSVSHRGQVAAGLPIGAPAPRALAEDEGRRIVLFLASDCGPCHEFARDLRDVSPATPLTVAISGAPEAAGEIAAVVPQGARVLLGPVGDAAASAAQVTYQPFAMAVDAGVVFAKSYPTSARSLELLFEGEKRR